MSKIIISLTSYPARIKTVHQTIKTLLNQTEKADKVVLWLATEQFPNREKDLPDELLELTKCGLDIDWYHDVKSYKKLIPALKKYPNDIIVTADDDLLYDKFWLEKLYQSYLTDKKSIHCHRITRLYFDKKNQLKTLARCLYFSDKINYEDVLKEKNAFNKLSGGAGALYPPKSYHPDIFDENIFMNLAPTSDDIWFWLQYLRSGIKVKVVKNNIAKLNYIKETQDIALCKINDKNDKKIFYAHLNAIINQYPDIIQKFQEDNEFNKQVIFLLLDKQPYIYAKDLMHWYYKIFHKYLNLKNPKTYNEKMQWLKLYDSTPLKTKLADKYLVRDWVKEKIGEEYLIPLLGVYDSFEEIDFNILPNQFVIKCNHGCGWNIIVKDKTILDLNDVKNKLEQWMNTNFAFQNGMELHYRDIQPKIIIEQFIENKNAQDLYDYKFWCFNGKVHYIQFLSERSKHLKMAFYDTNWHKQDFVYSYPLDEKTIKKPDNLEPMIKLSEKLAQDFSHVRVDFYRLDDGTIYFGEMTFSSASGSCKWSHKKINKHFGNLITLPKLGYNLDTKQYYKIQYPNRIIFFIELYINKISKFVFRVKYKDNKTIYKIFGITVLKLKSGRK